MITILVSSIEFQKFVKTWLVYFFTFPYFSDSVTKHDWLQANQKNVIVVHCKAGKVNRIFFSYLNANKR